MRARALFTIGLMALPLALPAQRGTTRRGGPPPASTRPPRPADLPPTLPGITPLRYRPSRLSMEGNPIYALLRYLFFGGGDVAPVAREVLRQAEPDRDRRPSVHVG